jgi:hypothetical protein
MYDSLLGILGALYLGIFEQPEDRANAFQSFKLFISKKAGSSLTGRF